MSDIITNMFKDSNGYFIAIYNLMPFIVACTMFLISAISNTLHKYLIYSAGGLLSFILYFVIGKMGLTGYRRTEIEGVNSGKCVSPIPFINAIIIQGDKVVTRLPEVSLFMSYTLMYLLIPQFMLPGPYNNYSLMTVSLVFLLFDFFKTQSSPCFGGGVFSKGWGWVTAFLIGSLTAGFINYILATTNHDLMYFREFHSQSAMCSVPRTKRYRCKYVDKHPSS